MKPSSYSIRQLLKYLTMVMLQIASVVQAQHSNDYGQLRQEPTESEIEYGVIRYASTPRTDAIATVIANQQAKLEFSTNRGYLESILAALNISPASQILVFSRTSLNVTHITTDTPRSIYFNDNTYVAWTSGSDVMEIASMDPKLGPVFYALNQNKDTGAQFEQQTSQCLRCHDSYSLTGGGVPRFILGSGYVAANGYLVSHEGWILTDPATPLKFRWGGWYVTGKHGNQVHLGNIIVNDPADLNQLENLRKGNLDNLDGMIKPGVYLSNHSDIVALMVIEHQVFIQNLITRVGYDIRTALNNNPELLIETTDNRVIPSEPINKLIRDISEPLVRAMLMTDDVPLEDTITGSSGYAEWFVKQGPADQQGRSLRELDLQTRLFRYPLSYLVYSAAFDNLPWLARQYIYQRFIEVLTGKDTSEDFRKLTTNDRSAILAILKETKPEFASITAK